LNLRTILIVDDDPDVLAMMGVILQKDGYAVIRAASPTEATRIFERKADSIDLLLTDVMMPKMNGCDLATKLVGMRPDLRVLFITGTDVEPIRHFNVTMHRDCACLPKPFRAEALRDVVSEVLREPALKMQSAGS